MLDEKSMSGAELDRDTNFSSTEKSNQCLFEKEKEKEESKKDEEYLIKHLTSLVEKASLKGN